VFTSDDEVGRGLVFIDEGWLSIDKEEGMTLGNNEEVANGWIEISTIGSEQIYCIVGNSVLARVIVGRCERL
jgi:hypothetical protein